MLSGGRESALFKWEEMMRIKFITRNKNGDYYVGYTIPVKRGIKGKDKAIVDELLIMGVPKSKWPEFAKIHHIPED